MKASQLLFAKMLRGPDGTLSFLTYPLSAGQLTFCIKTGAWVGALLRVCGQRAHTTLLEGNLLPFFGTPRHFRAAAFQSARQLIGNRTAVARGQGTSRDTGVQVPKSVPAAYPLLPKQGHHRRETICGQFYLWAHVYKSC